MKTINTKDFQKVQALLWGFLEDVHIELEALGGNDALEKHAREFVNSLGSFSKHLRKPLSITLWHTAEVYSKVEKKVENDERENNLMALRCLIELSDTLDRLAEECPSLAEPGRKRITDGFSEIINTIKIVQQTH